VRVFSYREVLCKSVEVQGVSEVSPIFYYLCGDFLSKSIIGK
jgi:hypothetical protein